MSDPVAPVPQPLPVSVPVSVSALVLRAKQMEIDAAAQLALRADLVDALGQLIQRLQRERGASSIFLASGGSRFADERRLLIEQSLAAQQRLRDVFAQHAEPSFGATAKSLSLMAWALLGLDAMDGLRSQIERRAMSAHDLVAAFSHLIAGLIELVFLVADAAGVPSVSRLLVALLHLVQAQEEAGQERAVGALMFASGQGSEAQQQRVLHLIEAQERSLVVFADFADAAVVGQWERQQLLPAVARLERLRRTLLTARPGSVLDTNLSQAWFDVSTERIDGLWLLQTGLVDSLRADCAERIVEARQHLLDSRGLLRTLRDNPPARTQAVDRFFDPALAPAALPAGATQQGEQAASLQALVSVQGERMAQMEQQLATARSALNERKLIERAKGMLMARLGMNEETAFRTLQKTSMDQNRRLQEVAETLLAQPDAVIAALAEAAAKGRR
jgi:hypothetical protein